MKGKHQFTANEASEIRRLLRRKNNAIRDEQKRIRGALRRIGFYITDFTNAYDGFTVDDFENLLRDGRIVIFNNAPQIPVSPSSTRLYPQRTEKDEMYIIDLCDEVLAIAALRQHRFDFLRGDAGTTLPVDAYYPSLNLVIEYREKQHSEVVDFFDRPNHLTVCGVHRGEQRRMYDQRRRDVLPQHGIDLVEFSYTDFAHKSDKRLVRQHVNDQEVIRQRLMRWIK
jgi:hypothetical protein